MKYQNSKSSINSLSNRVLGCAIEVHRELGPGLLESVYEDALCHELHSVGLAFSRQKSLPVKYKGIMLASAYRMDIVVENAIILEIKAANSHDPIFDAQLLTYLKLSRLWLGFILNFNVPTMKTGIRRIVN